MDKTEKSKKKQAGIFLIAGFLLFGVWNLFWFSPVYPLWQKLDGRLPENIYFPVEEFLALNGYHNSIYALSGSLIIAIGTIAWAWKLNGKLQKWYEYLLLFILFFVAAMISMPCLCRSREHARRLRCSAMLRQTYVALEFYARENGNTFPDTTDIPDTAQIGKIAHPVNYYGKGKSFTDKPFIILEDACRIHAGDMRHRIWSDGTREQFYPWRKTGDNK